MLTAAEHTGRGVPSPLPPGWWGPVWTTPRPLPLFELVRKGTLDSATAAMLWTLVETGHSLTVAAGPSGAGKTTLLTSLLDALPDVVHRRYVRGIYERIDPFAETGTVRTALLVNEISPHLPIYAWGPVVRLLLESAAQGCQLLTTIHAGSVDEAVEQLAAPPLRLSPRLLAQLGIIVLLEARQEGDSFSRRVRKVVRLSFDEGARALIARPVTLAGPDALLAARRSAVIDAFAGVDVWAFVAAMRAAR